MLKFVKALLDGALALLQGEPLRAIVYGAAVVIWFVSIASGRIPDISIDDALVQATAAAVALTETCRRFVVPVATLAGE